MTTVGTRLKKAREKAKLKQEDVILKLNKLGFDVKQSSLSRYENDKREMELKLLKALADIYQVNVLKIIYDDDEYQRLMERENGSI